MIPTSDNRSTQRSHVKSQIPTEPAIEETTRRMGYSLGSVGEVGDCILGYGHEYFVLERYTRYATCNTANHIGNDSLYHAHDTEYDNAMRCRAYP